MTIYPFAKTLEYCHKNSLSFCVHLVKRDNKQMLQMQCKALAKNLAKHSQETKLNSIKMSPPFLSFATNFSVWIDNIYSTNNLVIRKNA